MDRNENTNCQSCVNYVLDYDSGEYYCRVDLDEDEMVRFASKQNKGCPYYRFYDEYLSVRNQN